MEGTVLDFNQKSNEGVIKGSDGERFNFKKEDWKTSDLPKAGIKVDFVPKGALASQVYSVAGGSAIPHQVSEKFSEFASIETQSKVKALFDNGMHNKIGFGTSIAAILTLFMPALRIPFGEGGSLISFGSGGFIFLLLIILAILFYGGVTQRFVKILGGVTLFFIVLQYFSLFGALGEVQNTVGWAIQNYREKSVIKWGFYLNLLVNIVLILALYVLPYKKNPDTI